MNWRSCKHDCSLMISSVGALVIILQIKHNYANTVFLTCPHSLWAHHPISSSYPISWVSSWPFQEVWLSHLPSAGAAPSLGFLWQRKHSLPFKVIRRTKRTETKLRNEARKLSRTKHDENSLSAVYIKCFTFSTWKHASSHIAHAFLILSLSLETNMCNKNIFFKKIKQVRIQGWLLRYRT